MKVLITGARGFVGGYLAAECLSRGMKVTGWARELKSFKKASNAKDPNISKTMSGISWPAAQAPLEAVDLLNAPSVRAALKRVRPDWIFHLAAKSHIGQSWLTPLETLQTNISAQVNLLEAVRGLGLKSRIAIAGSSEEYGMIDPADVPIREKTSLKPVSPYAVSKVAQDLMGLQYFKNYGMPIVRLRLFNQTGPGRSEAFVTSAFARQVARIEAGLQKPLVHVGNLSAIRDFTDVRDAAVALCLALERGEAGDVYNICSGRGIPISVILDFLKHESTTRFKIVTDDSRMRPSDLPVIVGDGSKFRARTGWKPRIPFERSMRDLLAEWRTRVKNES